MMMGEDGRRWKKMEDDNEIKSKKVVFFIVGDGLGTLVGVRIAPKKMNPTEVTTKQKCN